MCGTYGEPCKKATVSRVTESQRGEKDGGRRKRHRYGDRDRAVEQDDCSLSGILTEGDNDDAARIRSSRR
jgi:hypothetical protein